MKLRWSHAVLYVRDLEGMLAFYREMLGFEVTDRGPLDPAHPALEIAFLSQIGSDHHQLAFAPVRGDGPSTTLDHIAFRVDSLAEVRELEARLSTDGRASGLGPVNHGNAWSVYFKDPEGNTIEVFCDSAFHVRQPQFRLRDPALEEADLGRATEREFGSEPDFVTMADFREAQRRRFGD